MKAPLSWLRAFVDVPADASSVASRLAACGFEVASVEGDVIDFEITANRPDCLAVFGLAREAATSFQLPLQPLRTGAAAEPIAASSGTPPAIPVTIEDEACGRYALAIVDVTVRPSPAWLADRLTAVGVRPINNVVDVTNYVMLEMGQPMHAFDAARLAGPAIHVRKARPGERLTTIDGEARALDEALLVIADALRPVAVAGVMGGAASEVSGSTSRIALESAWFQPAVVRMMSRRLGLKTEASARFERGADPDAAARAIARALTLFEELGAGRLAGPIVDLYPAPVGRRRVALRRERISRLLGDVVPDADVERILTSLGCELDAAPDGWRVEVPTFRVDVSREADLIEEVGRHWGFDRIPATFPPLRAMPRADAPSVGRGRTTRRVLAGAGFQEAATFTFIERAAAAPFAANDAALVPIANPLSEKFAVLRPSLLPGLLDALIYSRRRESANVRLFEIGSSFGPAGERTSAAWVLTGARDDHWGTPPGAVDFFDAKGAAELVAQAFAVTLTAEPADSVPGFVAGRIARLTAQGASGDMLVGVVGEIQPAIAMARGLASGETVVGGELDLGTLAAAAAPANAIDALPRFPSIVRDVSVLVDTGLPAAAVRGTIRATAPATLVAVREFDRYQGRGVPEGRVSLSIRLTFRAADRTLTDGDVQQAMDAIIDALARAHGAILRGQ